VIALVPVRAGILPNGADEVVAEAAGDVLLAGSGTADAAAALGVSTRRVRCWESDAFAPGWWAATLAPALSGAGPIVLPASPDGRDLAPRLAAVLGVPLLAGAVEVRGGQVVLSRLGDRVMDVVPLPPAAVITLIPGVRGVDEADRGGRPPAVERLELAPAPRTADATTVELLDPDAASVDLSEAPRILGGGAGLPGKEDFDTLAIVAAELGASVGGTRVVADAGWIPFERQIGSTGTMVNPELYIAFGISGAVQHTAGLGTPRHVVSVNTDASCPMSRMADLALVTDAEAMLNAMAGRLTSRNRADKGAS